ncbi:hypothetical protein D3C85_14270 [compost metagenome]
MRIISASTTIAELLPEVFYALDPDVPLDTMELPRSLRRYISNLIMAAFFFRGMEENAEQEWVNKIRNDPAFRIVYGAKYAWVDLDVIDTEGTFILIIEELHR